MKHIFLSLSLILLWSFKLYCQNPAIILAPNYLLISGGNTIPLPTPEGGYDGSTATRAQNIQLDKDNNLLFFIIDNTIYNKNGNIIDFLQVPLSSQFFLGYEEIAVFPKPDDCNKFYIITTGKNNGIYHSGYFELDFTNAGEEMLTPTLSYGQQFKDILPEFDPTEDFNFNAGKHAGTLMAVSREREDKSRFIFISNGYTIFRFKSTISGIVYDNFYYSLPEASFNQLSLRAEMELISLSDGTYRLATSFIGGDIPGGLGLYTSLSILELNINGDLIEDHLLGFSFSYTPYTEIRGLEFSPDGSKLYLTTTITDHWSFGLNYVDMNNISAGIIGLDYPNHEDFQHSHIETNMNGNLYFVNQNKMALLSNPNTPSSLNWNNNYLNINYNYTAYFEDENPEIVFSAFILQDQIDGMDYNSAINFGYDKTTYTALASATWQPNTVSIPNNNPLTTTTNNTVYIENELIIPAGKTITIKNMILKFHPQAKLTIEKSEVSGINGGKLILDNSTLTVDTRCKDEMWQGVTVNGMGSNYVHSLTQTLHATLIMENNSVISNARIGAYSYFGGIVRTLNSKFINNQVSCFLFGFVPQPEYPNLCRFEKTEFTWNNDIKFDQESSTPMHIAMSFFSGVQIINNKFKNGITNNTIQHFNKGIGVNSVSSSFSLKSSCNDNSDNNCPLSKKNTFENFDFAVRVDNLFWIQSTFIADFCDIKNCNCGIYVNLSKNEQITRNFIAVREKPIDNQDLLINQTYGIVLQNTSGFTVEENFITNFNNANIDNDNTNTFGIVIRNSGVNNNRIYKNSFKNLRVGTQAEGLNGNVSYKIPTRPEFSGLQWLCNLFVNQITLYDIGVYEGIVREEQGSMSNPTGNRFSLNQLSEPSEHDIRLNHATDIDEYPDMKYYHYNSFNHIPNSYTSNSYDYVEPTNSLLTYSQSNCPSNFNIQGPSPHGKSTTLGVLIQDLMQTWINGDSETLVNFIHTQQDKGIIKEELLKYSPYLSERIIHAYLDKNPNNNDAKDVLIANSALTNSVKERINGMTIPNGMKKLISDAQVGVSPREMLWSEISMLQSEKEYFQNKYFNELELNPNFEDSLTNELENLEDLSSKKVLLDFYILKENTQKINQLESFLIENGVSQEYIQLAHLRKNLKNYSSVKEAFEQDTTLEVTLTNFSTFENDIETSSIAKNILKMKNNNFYIEPFTPIEIFRGGNYNKQKENVKIQYNSNCSQIYPNPSTGSFIVDLVNEPLGSLEIEILDLSGKLVYSRSFENSNSQSIQLNGIANGMYLVNIKHNESIFETQKLEIRNK
ncbi:MAG: T9SS type A sorting domain-containing protein [Flavobacteriia bacterium]|nr:T9SS type A sorting domain-containing protein [Flavobacteriia bacterium]